MKVKLIIISIILLLVIVFTGGCSQFMENIGLVSPADEEQLSPEKSGPPDGLVKVLIGFKEKPGAAQQAMVKGAGGKIKYTYHIVDAIAASIPEKAIEALKKNPNVRYVEPDGQVYALDFTPDEELINSWGVNRIGAGIVHDLGNRGAGVKIAIMDSGVDYEHPDLIGRFDTDLKGCDFVNGDDDPMDDNGHGTHVAGTVAAEDNGVGVVGVAPEANLYALKVLNEKGIGDFSDVILALQWCEENDIQVTNNSYGSSGDPGDTLKAAFDNSASAGVLHVASAGNSGNPPARGDNVGYPAAYDSVIAVAATDQNDERARWSSTGSDVELSAPGVAINSTLLDGGYGEKSGTSMASPHVAGVASLVWANLANSNWTNDEVRAQLQNTADDLGATGKDDMYGYGLVNAAEAVGISPETGAIEGKVTDADNNIAIVGATVVVEGTTLSATTKDSGDYTIDNVPVGDYTVTALADGYKSVSQYNVMVNTDTITTDVNFTLNQLSETGTMYVESITFSAKKAGKNLFLYTTIKVLLEDDFTAVDGATVNMTLTQASSSWNFSGNTGSDGTVKFTLKVQSGNYTATVTEVSHPDYAWDKVETNDSCFLDEDGTVE